MSMMDVCETDLDAIVRVVISVNCEYNFLSSWRFIDAYDDFGVTNFLNLFSIFVLPLPDFDDIGFHDKFLFLKVLLAIGGWSGGSPTNAIEAYDPRAEAWLNVSTLPGKKHFMFFLVV